METIWKLLWGRNTSDWSFLRTGGACVLDVLVQTADSPAFTDKYQRQDGQQDRQLDRVIHRRLHRRNQRSSLAEVLNKTKLSLTTVKSHLG